jgi:hypothetical protein
MLLALLCLSPGFSLPAQESGGAAGLHACCRRGGSHHCMEASPRPEGTSGVESAVDARPASGPASATASAGAALAEPSPAAPSLTAPSLTAPSPACPYRGTLSGPAGAPGLLLPGRAMFAGPASHPAGIPQTLSRGRLTAARTRSQRGPPSPAA